MKFLFFLSAVLLGLFPGQAKAQEFLYLYARCVPQQTGWARMSELSSAVIASKMPPGFAKRMHPDYGFIGTKSYFSGQALEFWTNKNRDKFYLGKSSGNENTQLIDNSTMDDFRVLLDATVPGTFKTYLITSDMITLNSGETVALFYQTSTSTGFANRDASVYTSIGACWLSDNGSAKGLHVTPK